MNLKINNFGDLHKKGVYIITNIINKKVYVGSTTDSFKNRWNSHTKKLRSHTHPNAHLQNAWIFYGEESFVFSILEILETNILEREQYYIDNLQAFNPEKGYNLEIDVYKKEISDNTKNKISKTLKYKYSIGELKVEGCVCAGWNKGLKCNNISKVRREMFSSIQVFDYNNELIVTFRSCIDLCEWSEHNKLPNMVIGNKNKKGYILRRDKIYLSIRTGTCYKGLYFKKGEPLSPEMGIAKWENCWKGEIPNQQPSQSLTKLEGSETNS